VQLIPGDMPPCWPGPQTSLVIRTVTMGLLDDVRGRWLPLAFVLMAPGGCRKALPEGLDWKLLSEMKRYVDETAAQCDHLLERPCYSRSDEVAENLWGEPSKSASLPRLPSPDSVLSDPRVRDFTAFCSNWNRIAGEPSSCDATELHRPPKDSEHCRPAEFKGWESKKDQDGDYIQTVSGDCSPPWIYVEFERTTGRKHRFTAVLHLLPPQYLASHPEFTK
jgi:hypothetical protein